MHQIDKRIQELQSEAEELAGEQSVANQYELAFLKAIADHWDDIADLENMEKGAQQALSTISQTLFQVKNP